MLIKNEGRVRFSINTEILDCFKEPVFENSRSRQESHLILAVRGNPSEDKGVLFFECVPQKAGKFRTDRIVRQHFKGFDQHENIVGSLLGYFSKTMNEDFQIFSGGLPQIGTCVCVIQVEFLFGSTVNILRGRCIKNPRIVGGVLMTECFSLGGVSSIGPYL